MLPASVRADTLRGVDAVAQDLQRALVGAFAPLVRARLAERGLDEPAGLQEALLDGERWLADELGNLLEQAFTRQSRSPLEVFQEAMKFPTALLEAAGVAPLERDDAAVAALPGDLFDLAPASSQDLGEEAWKTHIAWGASKASAFIRPVAGLLSRDLMDGSKVESAVAASGHRLVIWRAAAAVEAYSQKSPEVVFVDLTHDDADRVIRFLAPSGSRVIAFGPHVDDFAMTRARTLGADDAVARSRFFRSIGDWLSPVV